MKYHKCPAVWLRIVVPSIVTVTALVTALRCDWIERTFGIDPDHHSGSIEWELIIAVFLAGMFFASLVPRGWFTTTLTATAGKGLCGDRADLQKGR